MRYYEVFFQRYKELADWSRLMEKVTKGDKRLQREQEISQAIAQKITKHPKPWVHFPIHYNGTRGRFFTEENDIYLLMMMNKHGYGNWSVIQNEFRIAPQFR